MIDTSAPPTTHVRVLTALLASAARLVPVPLVDDWLRGRILRYMVGRTLGAHGRTYPTTCVASLYEGQSGCLGGCLVFFFWLPLGLLLYPVRKIAGWVLAARWLSRDLTEALLLGRALDRCLDAGMLAGGSRAQLGAEAHMIRRAYDNAARGFDSRLLRHALAQAIAQVQGLPRAAVRTLRAIFRARQREEVQVSVPAAERPVIEQGVDAVEQALERKDVAAQLAEFDRVFDENLRILRARA